MSCIATSVGLGNVWRFPFVAYQNGGGAFLIPYIIVLILIGKPMYYLETVLGQFSSSNCVGIWALSPAMKGKNKWFFSNRLGWQTSVRPTSEASQALCRPYPRSSGHLTQYTHHRNTALIESSRYYLAVIFCKFEVLPQTECSTFWAGCILLSPTSIDYDIKIRNKRVPSVPVYFWLCICLKYLTFLLSKT